MHRLTATDTPMVRYTRTIFPSYAFILMNALIDAITSSLYIVRHTSITTLSL